MELREVLQGVDAEIEGDPSVEIDDLAHDSRHVGPGTLFFCVPGERTDGHDHAEAAVVAGASGLVVERRLGLGVAEALVADARGAMPAAAARFNGDPSRTLRVVGITGTNGKTTIAFLIHHLLEAAGTQAGLLGTVKSMIGGVEAEVERTTPEAIELQATLRAMLEGGDRACAIEVSSHALRLGRVDGVHFAVAVFTNLTQDHLDFHRDMEDYFLAKAMLFGVDSEHRAEHAVVNLDDEYGSRLAAHIAPAMGDRLVTFSAAGHPEATLRARDQEFDAAGSRFVLEGPFGTHEVSTGLPGDFNVENALAALGAVVALGVDPAGAVAALADAGRVPGRLEPIDEGQDFAVLVDYAHTPDSLENVLAAARRLTTSRLICVFGCGGDRDRAKRPLMGEIAGRLADLPIVTSDNPRSEEPQAILDEIVGGMGDGAHAEVVLDRRAAIARAFQSAEPGDTVVIAGKGHEQGQEFEGGRKLPFDDRDVAREERGRLGGDEA